MYGCLVSEQSIACGFILQRWLAAGLLTTGAASAIFRKSKRLQLQYPTQSEAFISAHSSRRIALRNGEIRAYLYSRSAMRGTTYMMSDSLAACCMQLCIRCLHQDGTATFTHLRNHGSLHS